MTSQEAHHRLREDDREVVIDWSSTLMQPEADIDRMIEWIRTSPRQRGIHVYLGSCRHRPRGRRLQNALLALGCVVTNKNAAAVA